MDRVRADSMGMLATTINALALQDTFIQAGLDTKVMTAVEMQTFADRYVTRDAVRAMENGQIVIFGCGLGAPYFSTDTAAALRAAEIEADVVLMAKNIDGVYSADPKVDPKAVRYDELTYKEILEKELKALDPTIDVSAIEKDESFAVKEEKGEIMFVQIGLFVLSGSIFGFVWLAYLLKSVKEYVSSFKSKIMWLLCALVPFASAFVMPRIFGQLQKQAKEKGIRLVGNKVIYAILGIIFPVMIVNVVALALMQKNINKLYKADEAIVEEVVA